MSQSNIIALALFVAFFVFITMRGELPQYLAVFGIGASAAAQPVIVGQTAASTSGASGLTKSLLDVGMMPGPFLKDYSSGSGLISGLAPFTSSGTGGL